MGNGIILTGGEGFLKMEKVRVEAALKSPFPHFGVNGAQAF
jgi:hypothetical protein